MNSTLGSVIGITVLIFGIGGSCAYGVPKYRVWQQSLSGEAELRKSEYSKQVAVEEAKARLESAALNAQAEVERARGVAEANKIIGDSLQGNEVYLRYLWIQNLADSHGETVYIPTEAGLPILESTRRLENSMKKNAEQKSEHE